MVSTRDARLPADDDVARMLAQADDTSAEVAHTDLFYRQLALHVARDATSSFIRTSGPRFPDGAAAIAAYVQHEEQNGRLAKNEVRVKGAGFWAEAKVSQCPFQRTCQSNQRTLGEVPQCLRAITLIQAMNTHAPERPPMTYDLKPGLVDGTSDACEIHLRPAGQPPRSTPLAR